MLRNTLALLSGSTASTPSASSTAVAAVSIAAATFVMTREEAHSSGGLHPASFPWPHYGITNSFDHSSIRRGFQVYRNVCSSCHGVERLAYRNLVGVAYTEAEVKAMVNEMQVVDGPDDNGDSFKRPGKLSDYIKGPYANEQKARKANNGALPPDLSLVVKARKANENYIFSILTGYREPPAGVVVSDPLHYNPYFPGSKIAMAQALFDGAVEYEDGTPATMTQMAKDVTVFLAWASEPETDERKRMGIKFLATTAVFIGTTFFWKRMKWAPLKTRELVHKKM